MAPPSTDAPPIGHDALAPALRRRLTVVCLVGLAGIAATLPSTGAEGSGMQWDNLVLAAVAATLAWCGVPLTLARTGRARVTARVAGAGAVLFVIANVLTGLGVGEGYGNRGPAGVVVHLAAWTPLLVCALLASQASHTRWAVMLLNALTSALSLTVVTTEFVGRAVDRSATLAGNDPDVVLGFAGYGALAVGGAAGLCTVAAAALRPAVRAQLLATTLFALSGCALALTLVFRTRWWELVADVSVVVGLLLAVVAIARTPEGPLVRAADRSAKVLLPGAAVAVASTALLPVSLLVDLASGRAPSSWVVGATAAVVLLSVARTLWRYQDREELTADLVRRDADMRELVSVVSDGVAVVDAGLRLVVVSGAARELLGLRSDDVEDPPLLDLLDPADRDRVAALLRDGVLAPRVLRLSLPADSGRTARQLEATVLRHGRGCRHVLHLRDVTDHHSRERELERLAFTDHLTGLPNRAQLTAALDGADAGPRCLLMLDLDGFKPVNDSRGHEAGDAVLVEVARRLGQLVRDVDLAARLGGDEFALVVAGDLAAATEVAERVVTALAAPFRLGRENVVIGASVGITLLAGSGTVALREADAALRDAKEAGKGCWRTWGGAPVTGLGDVLAAVAAGSVQVRYDALSEPVSGRVIGIEAGLRWEHPELGVLGAADLWAAAGRHGQQRPLRQWLLRQACAVAAATDGLHVGVPLPTELADPGSLVQDVTDALQATGLAPGRLALSLTEGLLHGAAGEVVPAMRGVHDLGVRLAVVDYGLGATLWGMLTRVPLDAVVVSLQTLASTGGLDRALRMLSGIGQAASEVGVRMIISDVTSPVVMARVGEMGSLAMTGPLLPSGLTADEATALVQPRPELTAR